VIPATRWQQIEALFDELVAADPERRAERLSAIGAEDPDLRSSVESLLETDAQGEDPVADAIGAAAESLLDHHEDRLLGKSIGSYRVTAILGYGGMSTVYRGERPDGSQRRVVAIKVLHQAAMHPRLRSRLHSERQILATLDHPYIARLFDSGELEDGTPYLMMEHVDGQSFHAYCDQRRLSLRERVDLFVKVCEAVQFAHRNLVVHRDIKPDNILVMADGTPKLLDFGIAKLLAPEGLNHTLPVTRLQERMLTPENAAPEQVLGRPITTATDIYALGVLLYQLLTGRSPYRLLSFSQLQLERAICMDDPVRPSQMVISKLSGESENDRNRIAERRGHTAIKLRAELSGDLDAIVATAMRKEPDRRYASVQAFAEDLNRHLLGRPVMARQGDWRYHTVKFVRRNYVGVIGVLTLIVGLAAITGIALWQNHRIALARDATAQERDRAQQVSAFLVDVFSQADPFRAQGHEPTAKDLLDRGAEKIIGNVTLQPEVRAELMESIGLAYRHQGLTEQSIALFEQALAIRRAERPVDNRRISAGLANLATALSQGGHLASAEADLTQALTLARSGGYGNAVQTADILVQYGSLALNGESQPDKALKLFHEALDIEQHSPGSPPLQIAATLNGLASAAIWLTDYRLAERYQRDALQIYELNTSRNHPDRAVAMANLGFILTKLGSYSEAERYLHEALDIETSVFGPNDGRVAEIQSTFGDLYDHQGDTARAIEATEQAAKISAQSRGKNHYITGYYLEALAILYLKADDVAAAERNIRAALAIYGQTLPARHLYVASARRWLGEVYLRRGDTAAAEAEMRAAVDITSSLVGEDNWRTARAQSALGWALIEAGKFAEGEPMLTDARARLLAAVGPHDEATLQASRRLAEYYRAHQRAAEAEKILATTTDP
jgi:serine/threonine protein kinase/tetratricopeptide (TPR) repeat protein